MKTCDLTVSRTIAASPEEVFEAWTDPESPGGPWFGAERAIIDPVVDGLFYHSVQHEGRTWPHYGRFVTLERPGTIEHTWVSEATQGVETVITVTLEAQDGKTLVTLRHAGVPDDEMGRQHEDGWAWMLSALADRFDERGDAATPT
jgi:uncharacterized protein YndB with AHSA1/START domain